MTEDQMRDVVAALNAQMENDEVQQLPSSLCRERGLVWLEGWFDLSAALSELPKTGEGEGLHEAAAYLLQCLEGWDRPAYLEHAISGVATALATPPTVDPSDEVRKLREALEAARSFILCTTVPYSRPERHLEQKAVLARINAALTKGNRND
jgi:hypothetical protein